jgi:hypothetical protein
MDDTLIQRPAPTPIPVLSPTLHCVAMTAFVYLRTSFGYTFLRPKSVFIAFSWAFMLGVIIAWNEPPIWREYRAVCIFGTGAVILYCSHLWIAFSREWRKRGEDDPYPGTLRTQRLARLFGFPAVAEETLRFWVEPGIVAFLSLVLRFAFGESHLSACLLFIAFCMVGREAINHWTTVRRDKAFLAGVKKAKEQGETLSPEYQNPQPQPKPVRTEPVEMKRNFPVPAKKDPETRFAEILRLVPPYTLEDAIENYKKIIRFEHPDGHENSPESNARTAELNDAVAFFREKFGA